jgi:hypothetical protein
LPVGRPFEVGNPGGPGRPPKGETFKDIYERLLSTITQEVTDPVTRQRVRLTAKEIMANSRVLRALKGDKSEQTYIENRVDGTPAETIQVQGTGELNIRVVKLTKEELAEQGSVEVNEFKPQPADGRAGGEPVDPGAGGTGT